MSNQNDLYIAGDGGGGSHYEISDEEIRRRLIQDFNIECGPVTTQTRRILLKKLIKLEQERMSSSAASVGGGASMTNNQQYVSNDSFNDSSSSMIRMASDSGFEHHSMITNGNTSGSNGEMNGSDDNIIIVEHQPIHILPEIIHMQPPRQQQQQSTPIIRRQSPRRTTHIKPRQSSTKKDDEQEAIKSFKEVEKTLKQPAMAKSELSKKAKSSTAVKEFVLPTHEESNIRLNEYSSESSDDNEDNNDAIPTISSPPNTLNSYKISGITMPRVSAQSTGPTSYRPGSLTRAPIRRSAQLFTDLSKKNSLLSYSDSESDTEHPRKDRIRQMLLNHRPGLTSAKPSFTKKIGSYFQNLKHKILPQTRKESNHFSTSTNYIPFSIIVFVVLFFTGIFSVYFYSKFTHASRNNLDLTDYTFIEDKSKLMAPICPNEIQTDCLAFESDRKPALNIIKEIKSFIDKKIYADYCGESSNLLDRPSIESNRFERAKLLQEIESNWSWEAAATDRDQSVRKMDGKNLLEYDLKNAFKLIKWNSAWNMKVDDYNSEITLMPNYNVNLPLQCRMKLFWVSNFWLIISTMIVLLMGTCFGGYYRYSKQVEIQEQEQVYDLIEKSMELLQSPDEPQSMPVLHIRDTLLSPAEKKSAKFKRIWNKVVNHIENSESRVKVEYKKIDGEEFKAWKWIATTNSPYITDSENDNDYLSQGQTQTQKIGGVEWQGQAFAFSANTKPSNQSINNETIEHSFQPELNRNKNFQALTRFLKIRNIFEKEAQYVDSNWSKKIQNTILEKTANTSENGKHDIVHIEIDDSTNEGLVFLKCGSMDGATNAFHALHGWWCEKKLVSVKFLKEERYYQRFPQAKHMNTPLQITNID